MVDSETLKNQVYLIMTTEHAKALIKETHRTLSAFARAAKWDRYELQKMFARKELTTKEEARIMAALANVEPEDPKLPADKLELLKSKIEEQGGAYQFAITDLKRWPMNQVYLAYNGKLGRSSAFLKKILKHFNI